MSVLSGRYLVIIATYGDTAGGSDAECGVRIHSLRTNSRKAADEIVIAFGKWPNVAKIIILDDID